MLCCAVCRARSSLVVSFAGMTMMLLLIVLEPDRSVLVAPLRETAYQGEVALGEPKVTLPIGPAALRPHHDHGDAPARQSPQCGPHPQGDEQRRWPYGAPAVDHTEAQPHQAGGVRNHGSQENARCGGEPGSDPGGMVAVPEYVPDGGEIHHGRQDDRRLVV